MHDLDAVSVFDDSFLPKRSSNYLAVDLYRYALQRQFEVLKELIEPQFPE